MDNCVFSDMRGALEAFERGYIERDLDSIDKFFGALFTDGEDISIVGTSTDELAFGREDVKQLIYDDWEGWGDMRLDIGGARFVQFGGEGFFIADGSVKYTFEHTPERYENYAEFVGGVASDDSLSPEQRLAFINWALSLTYHQRGDIKREYLWPMRLSGVMTKRAGGWKIAHLHFAIKRAIYPDERFENNKEYLASYREQAQTLNAHAHKASASNALNLQTLLLESGEASAFEGNISLDLDNVIEYQLNGSKYYIAAGINECAISISALAERALEDIKRISLSDMPARDKIFASHRRAAYALKEAASGERFTCPIRLTALLPESGALTPHISYPFSWIFEGKLDGV